MHVSAGAAGAFNLESDQGLALLPSFQRRRRSRIQKSSTFVRQ